MMKIRKIICLAVMLVCVFGLCACEYNPIVKNNIQVSGSVYFENALLDGVSIRSSTKNYCTTSQDGTFSFSDTSNSITIFAEKSGYIFSPKSITLTQSTSEIVFEATKITNLNGTLSLSKINIIPTSIANVQENYLYKQNGDNCLKVSQINISMNAREYTALNSPFYAIKNKNNEISFTNDLSINTCTPFKIEFSIDAYYSFASKEQIYTETKKSAINVQINQTNADLENFSQNEFGQIVYLSNGINSGNNNFSYNISFIFDYYPN